MDSHPRTTISPLKEPNRGNVTVFGKDQFVQSLGKEFAQDFGFQFIVYDSQVPSLSHTCHVRLGPDQTAPMKLIAASSANIEVVFCRYKYKKPII